MTDPTIDGSSKRERSRAKGGICFEYEHDEDTRRVRLAHNVDLPLDEFAMVQEPDGYEYATQLPAQQLPGAGERRITCGESLSPRFCEWCSSPDTVGQTCRQSLCPRCWQAWVFWRAQMVASKLETCRRDLWNEGRVWPHHLIVSFPESTRFRSENPEARAVEAAKLFLQRVNVDTGYLINHPYSIAPQYNDSHPEYDGSKEPLAWKDISALVEHNEWSLPAIREELLIFQPHLHVFGLSSFVSAMQHAPAIEDRTGVVIRWLATRRSDGKTRSIADVEELCRILVSELTHVGVSANENGINQAACRYFGTVANVEASSRATATVSETLREVAPPILGVDFPPRECTDQVVKTGPAHTADGTNQISGEGSSAATSTCGGQLRPMKEARQYLADPEKTAAVVDRVADGERRLAALRRAYEAWNEHDRHYEEGELLN